MIKLANKDERTEIKNTVINLTQQFTKNYSDIIDFKPQVNMNALLNSIYFKTYYILCTVTFAYFNIVYLFNIDWKMIFKK